MPILLQTGRRSWKRRFLVGAIYGVLALGGLSMLYPLLLMISGSTKSGVDQSESQLIPSFLLSDQALYEKHVEGLFNESLDLMRSVYDVDVYSFAGLRVPKDKRQGLVREWEAFIADTKLPPYTYSLGYTSVSRSQGIQPSNLRAFKAQLRARCGPNIAQVNGMLKREFGDWNSITVQLEDYRVRRNMPVNEPYEAAYTAFKSSSPLTERYYLVLEPFYRNGFLKNQYNRDLEAYNAAHHTTHTEWGQVQLPRRVPVNEPERADWEVFVREILNPLWIGVEESAAPAYRAYLQVRYPNLDVLNRRYQTAYASYNDIPLPRLPLPGGVGLADWNAFLQGWADPETKIVYRVPLESVVLRGVDFDFRDRLLSKYGSVAAVNTALGTTYTNAEEILPPQHEWHFQKFCDSRLSLRWELTSRNFVTVVNYVLLRGRGVLNTAVYCSLAVLGALIVNPLAAYGLSRYKPHGTYKVLLFLMITMAFPPMVTQIPAFLLVRDLNLLNTFWALILPGLASGYSIFLLKGFFDSLPQELYESASLDGAGELRIFWQITMSLSKPILAVIALNAFTLAYSNFMFALLICQDQNMWTITVWLYQLQSKSSPGLIYASLLLAAVPTLLVFVLCQNVIMRGIVVPVEK